MSNCMLKRNNLKNDKIYPSIANNGKSKFVCKLIPKLYKHKCNRTLKINYRVKKYLAKKQHPDPKIYFLCKINDQ